MSKTSVFTSITPLPAGITRQSVIDMYHNHVEMIDLNPLVVDRFQCKPPNYAPAEEYYSTWYTIKDKVSYLPGNLATGSVSYHACFHDLPDGLQTHVYAPLGLDIRAKWSVGGSLPGEPKQPVELGIGAPAEGLYIREDVKMKCNIMMISFVKKTFKESHSKLVDRLVEKAHAVEAQLASAGPNTPSVNSAHTRGNSTAAGHGYSPQSSQSPYPGSPPSRYASEAREGYGQSYASSSRQEPHHPQGYQNQMAPLELASDERPNKSGKGAYTAELPG